MMAARGDMAARSQPNASDSFVEQLLRSGPDVSGHDQAEAEAEEVDYGETDDDLQDAEGPHRMDRGRGARRSPAERGKHDPISWRSWQRPEPRRGRSRSRSRGPDLRSSRDGRHSREYHDRARAHAFAQEQEDRARWKAEQERPLPWPRHERSKSPGRMRLDRSYYSPEPPYYTMHGPHDSYLDSGHRFGESARYSHPSESYYLPELLPAREAHNGRPSREASSRLAERTYMHEPHSRGRLLDPLPARDLWPPQPAEYADDRQLPQRRMLLQRAAPEEERLIIRRPLTPERYSLREAWYPEAVDGSLAAKRRVEFDPRPLAGYPPVKDHDDRRHDPLPSQHERSSFRRRSPGRGHHSILRAAKGASSPAPREASEPSRTLRQLPRGQGRHEKQDKASHTERLPGPPILPGPPPVAEPDNAASRRRRTTLFSDVSHATPAEQATQDELSKGEQAQPQPDRRAGTVACEEIPGKVAHQEPRMSGVDHSEEPEQSQIVDERAASDPEGPESARAAATTAEGAGRTADTLHSKRPADGASADERESHSKRQRPEAGTGEHISMAPQVVASHEDSPGQDRESVEPQKGMGDDSKRSQSTEDRTEVLPPQHEDEKPQGPGKAEGEDIHPHKETASGKRASHPERADKGTAKAGSTFVRDFYAKADRSASGTAVDRKHRDGSGEARDVSRKAAKIRTDGRPHETNGGGRSSEAMRDAPRPASGRRDALKELRDRGGVRSSRSVRDKDVRRDGLRRSSESLRDAKSTKQKRLPSWLGDKHEESNEWFYMDPKGKLQGPCSISSFRLWLVRMKENPDLDCEREDFLKCMVWRKGMNRREPLERLLALADAEAAKK